MKMLSMQDNHKFHLVNRTNKFYKKLLKLIFYLLLYLNYAYLYLEYYVVIVFVLFYWSAIMLLRYIDTTFPISLRSGLWILVITYAVNRYSILFIYVNVDSIQRQFKAVRDQKVFNFHLILILNSSQNCSIWLLN